MSEWVNGFGEWRADRWDKNEEATGGRKKKEDDYKKRE